MRNLRLKARNELASLNAKAVTNVMLREWVRDKATVTEGCMGLDRPVQYQPLSKMDLDEDYREIQGVEEWVQTTQVGLKDYEDAAIQTENPKPQSRGMTRNRGLEEVSADD